jgi:hypothetical protein
LTTGAHLLVGGAVGSLTGEPVLAAGLGVVSHVVLDVFPHYDFRDYRVDVAIGVAIGAALIAGAIARGSMGSGYLWGMVGGVVPDLEILACKLGLMSDARRIFPTHRRGWIPHGAPRGARNLVTQGALGLAAVLVIFR